MKITANQTPETPNTGKKEKKPRATKSRVKATEPRKKRAIVGVPTSRRKKLVDEGVMRRHNFMSVTTPLVNKIYGMHRVDDRSNKYEAESLPHHVSTILKLTLKVMQTNDMQYDWTNILWNVTQSDVELPEGCSVTFVRAFERTDDALMRKRISRRRKLAILSSDSGENIKRQSVAGRHDMALLAALDQADHVVSFGAEAIVTAPDEPTLEVAMDAVKNYFASNDETRGMQYNMDINKQGNPFLTYGPSDTAGNRDIYVDMTSFDAAQTALFVDSGGDRTLGSEYMGVSVGKLIRSHAAYNFQNHTSLYVGNDTTGKTETIGGILNEPSQIYLSQVASRAYLLTGHKVTHFVADDSKSIPQLMAMPIDDKRKATADVSKGLLNLLEVIDNGELDDHPERILARFPTHINNIITLLGQFRENNQMSVSDDFANISRDILVDFFVQNKYWSYDARHDMSDLRLVGIKHMHMKKLSDFGQYIAERRRSNRDESIDAALNELNTIVNRNILPTLPALDTKTSDIIDELVRAQYRVVDLTGMTVGSNSTADNPALNVMMLSYLNLTLPSMSNGDVIVMHGISRMSGIARVIRDMIDSSGINVDVVYTEKNQNAALSMMAATADTVAEEDEETHVTKKVSRAMPIDFMVVDLYNNRVDKLTTTLGMRKNLVEFFSSSHSAYFVKTENGLDYIYLDRILDIPGLMA